MDHLLDMMHAIMNDNAETKALLTSLETTLARWQPPPSTTVRGVAAQRGGRIIRGKQRATAARGCAKPVSDESDNEDIDPSLLDYTTDLSTDTDDPQSESADEDGLVLAEVHLSDAETCSPWCRITNFSEVICTNAVTGQFYPTPFFDFKVSDRRNIAILRDVAKQDKKDWPKGLMRPAGKTDPTYDLSFVIYFAKKTFGSLRKQWNKQKKAQIGIETGATTAQIAATNTANATRRSTVSTLPYCVILSMNNMFLSDEVSGPESGSDETMEEWVERLRAASVAAKLPLSANARFLEILVPDWRSSPICDCLSGQISYPAICVLYDYQCDFRPRSYSYIGRHVHTTPEIKN
ncbi:hypothetical protein B0H14DRAFT_2588968 [Mycena olivaceomarginata]|nr:hypothetical protein B0H14DRAFT_2588968 [Mycena olivaceomarginata]